MDSTRKKFVGLAPQTITKYTNKCVDGSTRHEIKVAANSFFGVPCLGYMLC